MKEPVFKYLFFAFSGLLLVLMIVSSRDAGINCDEVLHYNHSLAVCKYFSSHGKDTSALDTPETLLKYYGQSYDNIVTILEKLLHIEDAYSFRHVMSSIAGWLTVLVTALLAVWLSGYGTGCLVILLFALSPTFLGHSQNNLKDIPFALGYISSLFMTLRFLDTGRKIPAKVTILLILSIAFTISIRAGGLLMLCYLFLFTFVWFIYRFLQDGNTDIEKIGIKLLHVLFIAVIAWALSIILWPFAQLNPVKNVIESYRVMAHFPGTFMQIFEGKMEWSDHMPWYYLIKSMAITIPLVVTAGFMVFLIQARKLPGSRVALYWIMILFTLLFPILFVLYEKSNLYSSWRQFLFIYPVIVLISAQGFGMLLEKFRGPWKSAAICVLIAVLSIHPARFMILNHRYSYLYYNQLTGGLKGAYGNYETDYYYVSQTEAATWLSDYLRQEKDTGIVKVMSTYTVSWMFRDNPRVVTSYCRFGERSMNDWDYAIITNRYIPPFQLKNGIWPPSYAIHNIYADGVPVCTVLKRQTKDDYLGYEALRQGRFNDAVNLYMKAAGNDCDDEMILYNYGTALYKNGAFAAADSVLKKGLGLNPDFSLINMYLGNIAVSQGRQEEAIEYYEKVIGSDRKYCEAYVGLAMLLKATDMKKTRNLLRECLTIDPRYRKAISVLADTYRDTDPEIAKKYDDLLHNMDKNR